MSSQLRSLLASLAVAALAAAPAYAQQGVGVVTGTVTDAAQGRPVADAQVVLEGTRLGARTTADGQYRIGAAPAGAATIRVVRIGYQGITRSVTVTAGGTATANFALAAAPAVLSQEIITAAGTVQSRRENGASVEQVNVADVEMAAVPNMSTLINGRTSGVTVQQSSGTTGTGSRIRIRGANSVSLSNEPLLVIDGVRIDNSAESNSIGVGGQSPSRLNDINPEDIETFDVIKGPAAAALYGTAAANGVIQITTKRGVAGKPKWSTFGELGSVVENNSYPANYGAWSTPGVYGLPGLPRRPTNPTCSLLYQAQGACTIDSLAAFNTIEESHPFRTGRHQKLGASVSGGNPLATYYLSGDQEREAGVYRTSNQDKLSLRANVLAHPASTVDVDVKTTFLRNNLQLPQNDNNYYGVIADGIAGYQANGPTQGYNPIGPDQFENIFTHQELNRFIGSTAANWRPLGWLSGNATLGLDYGTRADEELLQPDLIDFSDAGLGYRQANTTRTLTLTANYTATARYSPSSSVNTTTQAGYQFQRSQLHGTNTFGNTLVAGTGSLEGVTANRTFGEPYVDNKTVGGFVSEQLSFRDRLFVTGTVRGDKNSAFGANFKFITYPSASVSYVALEGGDVLSQLRLRTAYGVSGLRPGILDARPYFLPISGRVNGVSVGGFTVGNFDNNDLKPERSSEIEGGFDLSLLRDRANLAVTYYDKTSSDALISVPLAPSFGGPTSIFRNIGSTRNSGLEMSLTGNVFDTPHARLELSLNASTNRNRLTSLGGQPAFAFGLNSSQRMIEGYPLGGYWGNTIDSVRANKNGSLSPDSVFFSSDTADLHFLGSPSPTRFGSIGGGLTLFKIFKVSSLFDYRGGNKLYNATEQFRCSFQTCRAANDAKAPIADQANAYAAGLTGTFYGGYVEDASFVKWRELSVSVGAPSRWARLARASDVSLTLAGRNLHTWTKYTGLDPEVNFGGQSNFTTADFLTQPQVRYYTARLNLTY